MTVAGEMRWWIMRMMLLLVRRSQRGPCRPSQFLERAEESDIVYAQEGLALSSLHSQPDVMQSYSGMDVEHL